jgi:CRP-like cAMP-binding protein
MDLESIRRVDMFQGLNDGELGKIFQLAKETDYRTGDLIVRENAPGGMLHVILEGEVEIRKKAGESGERPLALLSQGAIFGEMSLFDGFPYSASVVVKAETRTLSMFRNDFMALAETDPSLAFKVTVNLIKTLSSKLRKTNENLVTLALLHQQPS